MKTLFYVSPSGEGHRNLAVDEWLLDTLGKDDMALYFYINKNAVIIGKNQNPWKECNLTHMREDGVELVRRITGGGAVYHDEGNLNFSFIAGVNRYDEHKQFELILNAVRRLGIPCEFSGKNDLKADGMKFSGNAFCKRGETRQHHGTLLVSADLKKLSNYLNPDPLKMKAKGINSVRQKVCNLNEFNEKLTTDMMLGAIKEAYKEVYGEYSELELTEKDEREIAPYYEKQCSWEWMMGNTPQFDVLLEERFNWGGMQLHINAKNGKISEIKVYTDANDANLAGICEEALLETRFNKEDMSEALLKTGREELADVSKFILSKNI